jgi:FixJ family two-component response regulator
MKNAYMSNGAPIVFLLDDEPNVVAALGRVLRGSGFLIRGWTCASEFLKAHDEETPGCLITDLRMPGMSGLEVQRALRARGIERPVIFITGQGDVRTVVQGMRAGAVTFLTKPVQAAELTGAVREAIRIDAQRRARRCEQANISARLARLTPREHQVLHLLTTGILNKQIAAELGVAEKTIKTHRREVLRKMEVRTATALVGLLYGAKLRHNEVIHSVETRTAATQVSPIMVGQGSAAYI